MHDVDVLIAGAGASGLSLAVRLANAGIGVHVLDARSEPVVDDRTFCGFRCVPHPFEAAIVRVYDRIEVRHAERAVVRRLGRHPYEEIPGARFQAMAIERLAACGNAKVTWNAEVRTFRERASDVVVTTSQGEVQARLFVDARGGSRLGWVESEPPAGDVRWLQHFVGWEVRVERPCFVPGVATLMDFDVDQGLGPHFVYVLPRSRHEALVEDTYFSPESLGFARYEATLERWLERRQAGSVTVLRTEAGQIPMTTAPVSRARSSRVVVIGQRGGAVKPSSGFAFHFIQRQCDALTALVKAQGVERPLPWIRGHTPVATFLDRVMLSFLKRRPDSAPAVFTALFETVPGDRLARFLSECATPLDLIAVMASVAPFGLGAEAIRARRVWLRSS